MLLTSPFFLFLFLPLSLPLILLLPRAGKRIALSLCSLLWVALLYLHALLGLVQLLALTALATLLAYLPLPRRVSMAKLRTVLGVAMPLLALITARLLAEYAPFAYVYPRGILLLSLSIVSYFVDVARGDVITPKNPLELVGYFLFFPTLTMGPILRSKTFFDLTEELSFDAECFTQGIRSYMLGYVKQLAIAAVFLRAMQDILTFSALSLHPVSYLLLLLFALLCFYFYATGAVDLACGVSAMYGLRLPEGYRSFAGAVSPHRVFCGVFLSFDHYLSDYVRQPLRRYFGGKTADALLATLLVLVTALVWRLHPAMLLLALPLMVFAALGCLPVFGRLRLRHFALKLILSLVSCIVLAPFAFGLLCADPMDALRLASSALSYTASQPAQYMFSMIQSARYLLWIGAVLVLSLPYPYLRRVLCKRLGKRFGFSLLIMETVLLFAAFVLTILFLMPQFPQYADYGIFLM